MTQPEEDPRNKKETDTFKDKIKESLNSFTKNEKVEGMYNYAKHNTRDTIAYILLLAGLLLMFYQPWYGGILVGLIFGLYYSKELMEAITHVEQYVNEQGFVKSLILGGLLLGLLIAAPYIFIGTAFALGLRYLLISS
jgi:hypothetical protein